MNNLPNISLNFSLPECGLVYKIDLNLPVLLLKSQEVFGADLKPVIITLLLRFVR